MATEGLVVSAEYDPVSALLLNTITVVSEAVGRVEVEDPQETSTLEDDDLVTLMLQADVRLWRM